MQNKGCGATILERGWILSFSGVAQDERHWTGVGILTNLWLSKAMLELSPQNERVDILAVVCAYAPNSSLE